MLKLFQPNKIFQITSKAPKYVLFLFVVVLSVGLIEALVLSPEDYKQSDAVRIMYVHVPAAWISLGIFSSITFLSISGFILIMAGFSLILSAVRSWAPVWITETISSMSFLSHFSRIQMGVFDLNSLIFFLSMIILCLWINIQLVQIKKAD